MLLLFVTPVDEAAGLTGLLAAAGLVEDAGKLPEPAANLFRYFILPPHWRPKFWALLTLVWTTRISMKTCLSGTSRFWIRSRSLVSVSASPEASRELVTLIHWSELTALRRFW